MKCFNACLWVRVTALNCLLHAIMNFELLAGLSKSALEGKTSGERAGVDIHDCISATGGYILWGYQFWWFWY